MPLAVMLQPTLKLSPPPLYRVISILASAASRFTNVVMLSQRCGEELWSPVMWRHNQPNYQTYLTKSTKPRASFVGRLSQEE